MLPPVWAVSVFAMIDLRLKFLIVIGKVLTGEYLVGGQVLFNIEMEENHYKVPVHLNEWLRYSGNILRNKFED